MLRAVRRLMVPVVAMAFAVGCAQVGAPRPPVPPPATPAPPPATSAAAPAGVVRTATPTSAPAPTPTPGAATAPPLTPAPTATQLRVAAPSEPQMIASTFETALNQGDVDGAMALLADGAEVKIPPDRYVGTAQIRGWVEYLAAQHFAIEPGLRDVAGERVSWPAEITSDYLQRIGLPSLTGTTTLVVKDGRIASYTFVLDRESAGRHRAAQMAASQVLQDPVIVGADAANVYGFNDVFRDPQGKIVSYRDVLAAEPGSGPYHDLGGQPIVIRSGF